MTGPLAGSSVGQAVSSPGDIVRRWDDAALENDEPQRGTPPILNKTLSEDPPRFLVF